MKSDESYEFALSDAFSAIVPDTMIDTAAIVKYYRTTIDTNLLSQYYFLTGVKVSKYIRNRFVEIDANATVNGGSVMTLNGKVYNSMNDYYSDYFVSVDWNPLAGFIPKNLRPARFVKPDTIRALKLFQLK